MNYYTLPYIHEKDGRYERTWDIYSRLLKDRIIFIGVPIDNFVANAVIAQLLFLNMESSSDDIHLYINSSGGSITAGMAIYDTMNFIECNVNTYCIGLSASIATLILSAGVKGKRYALPNSRIMIHQPIGGISGQASDISIAAKEILRWKKSIIKILSEVSNQSYEKIEQDSDRDFYMNSEEAKYYGLIDSVITGKLKK